MEWSTFEEQFFAATRQEPCEHGEDAVEWDHSRYSRALGLTGQPGLHQLRRTGLFRVLGAPTYWDESAKRLATWAGQVGWSLLRVSARPTVAVPDPVIAAIGRALTPDGLAFLRSGASGRPAVRSGRVRPAGMSIPLTPPTAG